MGITGFTEWFLKTFPRTVVPVQGQIQPYIDHVFIDMNQFVHKAARTAKSYDMLWKRMYRELDNILNVTNPRQSVYIVMDGPASRAKQIDQRKRRKTKKGGGTSKKPKGIIDRSMITPGCKFTGQVIDSLAYYICQRLSSRKYENVKFYVSGANVAGEGELKIMKYIKSMPEGKQQVDRFALVGSDADLVLLAISAQVPNMSILSAQTNNKVKGPRKDGYIEIGIDKLNAEFSKLLPKCNTSQIGTDFVALSILSGNDYLPKVPTFLIQTYWGHYLKARSSPRWESEPLVDPTSHRLNLAFFDSLLSNAPLRSLDNPPNHHHRRYIKVCQLRADLASGKIKRAEIIARYSTVKDEPEEDEDVLVVEEEDDEVFEDLDDDDEVLVVSNENDMDITPNSVEIPIKRSTPIVSAIPASTTPKPSVGADGRQIQAPRDPIDVWLDYSSRDTWAEYDADHHASEFVFGIEWVVNSYLRGECLSNDWFFPYSSAPGPKQLREFIAKTKTNPNLIKALPTEPNPAQIFQPWMFAMMLLDSKSYHYLSDALPTEFADDSYAKEVHDPAYFYPFIDSDRLALELAQLDVSSMPHEDIQYSMLGNIHMYEKSFSHNPRAPGVTVSPASPFQNPTPLRGYFRRHSVSDLTSHHITIGSSRGQQRPLQQRDDRPNQRNDDYYRSRSHPSGPQSDQSGREQHRNQQNSSSHQGQNQNGRNQDKKRASQSHDSRGITPERQSDRVNPLDPSNKQQQSRAYSTSAQSADSPKVLARNGPNQKQRNNPQYAASSGATPQATPAPATSTQNTSGTKVSLDALFGSAPASPMQPSSFSPLLPLQPTAMPPMMTFPTVQMPAPQNAMIGVAPTFSVAPSGSVMNSFNPFLPSAPM